MKRIKYLEIGAISEGTLETDDLLSEAVWALAHICRRNKQVRGLDLRAKNRLVREANAMLATWDEEDCEDSTEASDLLDEIIEALGEFAPPYCYVGFDEGDGACFGCFVSMDCVTEAVSDREIIKIDELSEATEPGQYLHVNDHGNMTLYTRFANHKTREEWAVV